MDWTVPKGPAHAAGQRPLTSDRWSGALLFCPQTWRKLLMQLGCEKAVPEGLILKEKEGCRCSCSYRCGCRSGMLWPSLEASSTSQSPWQHALSSQLCSCLSHAVQRSTAGLFISFKLSPIAAALLSENPFVDISSGALELIQQFRCSRSQAVQRKIIGFFFFSSIM